MRIEPFKLERYFAKHEFSAPYLFSCSDCEALTTEELLAMADDESLDLWNNLKLSYTDSKGHPLLRKEGAKLYETMTAEDLLVAVPEEGIYLSMQSILEAGDHVVVTYPGYQSLYQIAESLGCKVDGWKPRYEEGWVFDVEDLTALVTDDTRLIVINFPHNPTGATISQDELDHIIQIARTHDCMVFSDEMYRGLEHEPGTRLRSAADMYHKAISLSGMSKTYALPGLRIGWLATHNRVLYDRIASYKDYTTICSSGPSELLAIMGLRAGDRIIARNLKIMKDNLQLLDDFFNERNELFDWKRPTAGPIGFPVLKAEVSMAALAEELVKEVGVMVLSADRYDYEVNAFRVGYARKNMPEVLDKFGGYADKILK